ncbi:MAG: response regulator [Kofleriaceae bacterium]
MREVLELSGHRVVEAADGLEGLACILAEPPEIAIIDVGLPGIDGHEVARRVRAALGNAVVLVALTGRSKDSDRVAALAAGFDAHIVKPVDRALIARILETKRLTA